MDNLERVNDPQNHLEEEALNTEGAEGPAAAQAADLESPPDVAEPQAAAESSEEAQPIAEAAAESLQEPEPEPAEDAQEPEPEPAAIAAEDAQEPEPEPAAIAAEDAQEPEPEPAAIAAEDAQEPEPEPTEDVPEAEPAAPRPVAEDAEEAEPEAPDEAASEPLSMADFVDDYQYTPLKPGDIRDGIIVSISSNEILVDVGAKSEGFISGREMEKLGKEYLDDLDVGASVVVYVVRPEDRDGNIVLSLARAQQERDWREAERLLESGDVFQSSIVGYNKGGAICRLGKVRGFIPASQLVSKPESRGESPDERWAGLVGKTLWLKVVELDRRRNRLILSERQAVRERRRQVKDELLSDLKKGDTRRGTVSSIAKFGAFVDLGGADGLVHISELSWARVKHPSEVVKMGDEVEVYVLNVDRERRRIGLSLRRLQPEPWSVVHERYAVGQVVEGVITKLASFGAFARIEGLIEGLIHISELAHHRVTHPKEVLKEGDRLPLRIIRIDPARRRIGLSLKRVAEEEYAELDWREAEGVDENGDDFEEDWEDEFEDATETMST